jgi:hypothetical protein
MRPTGQGEGKEFAMECRFKWPEDRVKQVNHEWKQIIRATRRSGSQIEFVGILVTADRTLENLLKAVNWSGDSTADKLLSMRSLIPDFVSVAKARGVRNVAAHEWIEIRYDKLMFALLEYQRLFEVLGVPLEKKIELDRGRKGAGRASTQPNRFGKAGVRPHPASIHP